MMRAFVRGMALCGVETRGFKLIVVFVADEKSDDVLDAAGAAGATDATIIDNAQGQVLKKEFFQTSMKGLSPEAQPSNADSYRGRCGETGENCMIGYNGEPAMSGFWRGLRSEYQGLYLDLHHPLTEAHLRAQAGVCLEFIFDEPDVPLNTKYPQRGLQSLA